MSLSEFALRVATVRALRGQTLAGTQVLDEPVNPEENVVDGSTGEEKARIIIAVYTNQSVSKPDHRDLLNSENTVDLTIQIYVPYETEIGGTEETGPLKGRSAGARFLTDMISRQILKVASYTDSPWAHMLRAIVVKYIEIRSQSFVMASRGKYELSAREMVIKVQPVSEPNFGAAPTDMWADFIALVTAESDMAPLAPLITEHFIGATGTQWQRDMADIGTHRDFMAGLGITLDHLQPPEDALPTTQITIQNEEGGGVVVDNGAHVTED